MRVCLIRYPGLCSIVVLAWMSIWKLFRWPSLLPHGVEDSSVLHDAKQLVGGGHVVRDRPLAISEKGVRSPDLADHEVVQPQDFYWALEFQALINPRLAEEDVHGVLLEKGHGRDSGIIIFTTTTTANASAATSSITP